MKILKIHNTLGNTLEEFKPINPLNVRVYACGPTVYNYAHIGNARMAVVNDLLIRFLKTLYPKVTYVSNITDIDDKIIAASQENKISIKELTEKYTKIYNEDMSVLGVNQPDIQPTSVNVFSFIDTVTTSLSPLTKGKDLKLLNDVSDKDLMITVDKAKLRRIMVNLISNGIKFTKEGYVKISCIEKDDFVEFCIADTGIGLKENQQDVIFEKFRQVDYSSTREFEGIGLGLSIVKELVQLHEGDVRVESYFGQGSSFYFTIKKKRNLTATMVT